MKHFKISLLMLVIFSLAVGHAMAGNAIWIDVRSQAEWNADHIEGPSLIPHDTIGSEISKLNLEKDAPITLYCRSGNRAGIAKRKLEELGYSNVKNVGSIDAARQLRTERE